MSLLEKDWRMFAAGSLLYDGEAPVAWGEATPEELFILADHPSIAAIYFDAPAVPLLSTAYIDTIQANWLAYDGVGRKICVIEGAYLDAVGGLTIAGSYCGVPPTLSHGRVMMGFIRSTVAPYGTATGSTDYFAAYSCDNNAAPAMDYCATVGADIWSFSYLGDLGDTRLFDYHAKVTPYPFIAVSSGNQEDLQGQCPTSCTNSRNSAVNTIFSGIVAGGSDDCGDLTRSNDKIWCGSCDLNPADQREFPHLVAPANVLHLPEDDCLTSSVWRIMEPV